MIAKSFIRERSQGFTIMEELVGTARDGCVRVARAIAVADVTLEVGG
jgi:hypothetical protein